jgi:cytochrome c553
MAPGGSGENRARYLSAPRSWPRWIMKLAPPMTTRITIFALSFAFCVAGEGGADAQGDIKAGREKAQKCEACHGLDGLAKIAESPNIAGQNQQYLIEQLTAFKSGERKNDMMSLIAPALSDQDIEDLAAYYAAIEVKVGKIPDK